MLPKVLGIGNTVREWSRNEIGPPQLSQKCMGDPLVANCVEGRIRGLDGREKTREVSCLTRWYGRMNVEGRVIPG